MAMSAPICRAPAANWRAHLLDEAELHNVRVETTHAGDHYDPGASLRAARSSSITTESRSRPSRLPRMRWRMRSSMRARESAFMRRMALVGQLVWVDRIATGILLLTPVVFAVLHSPALVVVQIVAGVALLATHVVVHAHDAAGRIRCQFRQGAAGPAGRTLSSRRGTCRAHAAR